MDKKNNIILIGFMGCGKSSVGVRLSKHLDMPFLDTDSCIEEKAGKKICRKSPSFLLYEKRKICYTDSVRKKTIGAQYGRFFLMKIGRERKNAFHLLG